MSLVLDASNQFRSNQYHAALDTLNKAYELLDQEHEESDLQKVVHNWASWIESFIELLP
jgi:16S rRNA G527 N7-methylase RsmG